MPIEHRPTPEGRLVRLEDQVRDLVSRLGRLSGTGVSTSGGATSVRTTQLGFPAELTAVWDDEVGYAWKRLTLDTTADPLALADPGIQPTGDQAYPITGDTELEEGTRGWLEPSADGPGYLFIPEATADPAPGTAAAAGCDAWTGLSTTLSCPTWETEGAPSGLCSGVPQQSGGFAYSEDDSGSTDTWTSRVNADGVVIATDDPDYEPSFVTTLTADDGDDPELRTTSGDLFLTVEGGPSLTYRYWEAGDTPGTYTKSYPLTYRGCVGGVLYFVGGGHRLCEGDATTCGNDTFVVGVRCDACSGVTTACCPVDGIPRNLCLTLSNVRDTAGGVFDTTREWIAAFGDQVLLTFESTIGWTAARSIPGVGPFRWVLKCENEAIGFVLDMHADNTGIGVLAANDGLWGSVALDSCSPFALSGTLAEQYPFGERPEVVDFAVAPYDPEAGCGGGGDGSDCDEAMALTCGTSATITVPSGATRWLAVDTGDSLTVNFTGGTGTLTAYAGTCDSLGVALGSTDGSSPLVLTGLTPGTVLLELVNTGSGADFTVTTTCPGEGGADCASAVEILCGVGVLTTFAAAGEQWFKVVLAETRDLFLGAYFGTAGSGGVYVYSDCSGTLVTPSTGANPFSTGMSLQDAPAGTYYLKVVANGAGNVQIGVACQTPDLCCGITGDNTATLKLVIDDGPNAGEYTLTYGSSLGWPTGWSPTGSYPQAIGGSAFIVYCDAGTWKAYPAGGTAADSVTCDPFLATWSGLYGSTSLSVELP